MNEVESSSSSAPPAPPPPISLLPQQGPKLCPQNLNSPTKVDKNKLEVAISRLLSTEGSLNVFYKCNTPVVPQLQDGPKCGLVALSIATSSGQDFVKVDDIFETALSQGLTKQGEMFSVDSLALLAQTCCGFKTKVIHGGLHSHLNCILRSLMRKCLLLVPYDADFNHAPCCKRGMKAHWTVITGFVLVTRDNPDNNQQDEKAIKINTKCSAPCNCSNSNNSILPLTISNGEGTLIIGNGSRETSQENLQEGKIYLIGLQGKSQHIGLWSFDDMANSNDNLSVFSTNRDSNFYVLPEGGLEEGLKGKAIILEYF